MVAQAHKSKALRIDVAASASRVALSEVEAAPLAFQVLKPTMIREVVVLAWAVEQLLVVAAGC